MKAAMYQGPGKIELTDVPDPQPQKNEYLVKVMYSGLCGTDLKTFKQGHRFFPPPCILGHEFSGVIIDAGTEADQSLIGSKITCAPYVPCHNCTDCRNELYELCNHKDGISSGTFCEYITIPKTVAEKGMVVLSDDCNMVELSLAEPVACVLNSVRKLGFKPGNNVLVMGAGPMGLIHAEILKKFGANQVLVTDFNEQRLAVARELGAHVANPKQTDLRQWIDGQTGADGLTDIVVAIGTPQAVEEAFNYAGNGTTINIFGGLASDTRINIDPNSIHYKEVRLIGSFGFAPNDFKMAARLLQSHSISLGKIVTSVIELKSIEEAFAMSLRQETIKAVISI
ncbi:MAG TPA: hypothetical protein DER58_03440 [Firmicutes bacterium]|nr:hypothetical protein [Bacillota bacterium]